MAIEVKFDFVWFFFLNSQLTQRDKMLDNMCSKAGLVREASGIGRKLPGVAVPAHKRANSSGQMGPGSAQPAIESAKEPLGNIANGHGRRVTNEAARVLRYALFHLTYV